MRKIEPFTFGNFYHVYNRGINGCDIFKENENYDYFLKLYDQHVSPVADTFAWVLMPNHFHFLLRVKDVREISSGDNPAGVPNPGRVKQPSQQMGNLFNAYAQAFNKRYNRHGSLLESPFKRKPVHNIEYLRNMVLYIHDNPVHHHFCEDKLDYPWSSYFTCITVKPTKLKRETVIGWFDDAANFKYMHNKDIDIDGIENWLDI
jgi:putative transposase